MPNKKQIIVDSSNNPVECFTIAKAAKYVGTTKDHLRLQLYKNKTLPYYKVVGKSGSKIIRIKKTDLDTFVVDQKLFDRIADKIKQARAEHVIVRMGMSQKELAKELKITDIHMNHVERKKVRAGIKLLEKIGKITGNPLSWFLE